MFIALSEEFVHKLDFIAHDFEHKTGNRPPYRFFIEASIDAMFFSLLEKSSSGVCDGGDE